MVGGEDEHSSAASAERGGDPSLWLTGFIIRLRCSALPEERDAARARGLRGPVLPLEEWGRLQSFSGFAFLSTRSRVFDGLNQVRRGKGCPVIPAAGKDHARIC